MAKHLKAENIMGAYHHLVSVDSDGCHIEFGDFSLNCVRQEARDIQHNHKRGSLYIVTLDSAVCSPADIQRQVTTLINGGTV